MRLLGGQKSGALRKRLPMLAKPVPTERLELARNVAADPLTAEDLELLAMRPRVRAECKAGPRPCPWMGCRHHLCLEVSDETGSIKLVHEDLETAPETCSLDVADRGVEQTLEVVGIAMNVTRERIRQIEVRANEALYLGLRRAGFKPAEVLAAIGERSDRTTDWRPS